VLGTGVVVGIVVGHYDVLDLVGLLVNIAVGSHLGSSILLVLLEGQLKQIHAVLDYLVLDFG
jgi:hypothetical protein